MKKTIISVSLGMAACLSSFGQGYVTFTDSGGTAIMDNFTTPGTAVKSAGNVIIGIMWSATAGKTVASFGPNASTGSTTPSWAGVTSDANYHLALAGGVAISAPTRTGLSLGTFNGGVVGIDGTTPNEVVTLYVVAWKLSDGINGYGSSSVLGWSNPFVETLGSSATPGLTFASGMSGPVSVNSVSAVPEPATFALAGIGAAAMLIFRRKKKR